MKKQASKLCPDCLGSGVWHIEIPEGLPVPVGRCNVCVGTGYVKEGYDAKANIKTVREVCICAAAISTTDIVIRGHRHRDCIEGMIRRGLKPKPTWDAQGFITSYGRYVNRIEAFKLQKQAEIESANPEGYNSAGWLFSEDLY